MAIDSYELGYLRDSLAELSQHQLENEAHEAVRRHARQLAERTGIPARELVEGTRIRRQQQLQPQVFDLQTPRGNLPLTLPSDRLTGSHSIANPVGQPLDQLVADREVAQAQRQLDRQFHEAEQRSSIQRSTEIARSRLDEFAEHGAIGHTRSALWHAAALASHGTAASIQTVGNVAGATVGVVDTGMNVLTGLPHPLTASVRIMNQLASAALSGTGRAAQATAGATGQALSLTGNAAQATASATGQALSLTGNAAQATMSATGPVFGAMRSGVQSASSSSGRWERRGVGIYERVVDPIVTAAVESAL